MQKYYTKVLNICNTEKAIREGLFFDVMYVNYNQGMNEHRQYAFLRKAGRDSLLILVNFGEQHSKVSVNIPKHAVDFLGLPTGDLLAKELLTGEDRFMELTPDVDFPLTVPALGGIVLKF